MSQPLLRVEDVGREFDGGKVVALRGVNLSIAPGDCLAILGKSGSGKSSLIHIMGGCDQPSSGALYWKGGRVGGMDAWRRLRATEIGIVFQEYLLLPALTAIENVEMALLANGMPAGARRRRSGELLAQVGLKDRLHHLPNALSGGERQRVAIARSIANEPALLLADEPTGNLDSTNAVLIVDLLLEIQRSRGTALVMVTHDASLAARCRRRVIIRDGVLVEEQQLAGEAP